MLVRHYTNYENYQSILDDGFIRPNHSRNGFGVFVTTLGVGFWSYPAFELLENNYYNTVTSNTQDRADYYIQFRIDPSRLWKIEDRGRDAYRIEGTVFLHANDVWDVSDGVTEPQLSNYANYAPPRQLQPPRQQQPPRQLHSNSGKWCILIVLAATAALTASEHCSSTKMRCTHSRVAIATVSSRTIMHCSSTVGLCTTPLTTKSNTNEKDTTFGQQLENLLFSGVHRRRKTSELLQTNNNTSCIKMSWLLTLPVHQHLCDSNDSNFNNNTLSCENEITVSASEFSAKFPGGAKALEAFVRSKLSQCFQEWVTKCQQQQEKSNLEEISAEVTDVRATGTGVEIVFQLAYSTVAGGGSSEEKREAFAL